MFHCGLAQVAILSLIAVKLASKDCSGFHVSGSELLVPSCLISQSYFPGAVFCKPCGLLVSQGSEGR